MTRLDLEAVKLKQGLQLKKWDKIDKVINRGTLVALWIVLALILGLGIGIAIAQ